MKTMYRRHNLNISTCTVSSQMLGISAVALCRARVTVSQALSMFSSVNSPPHFSSVNHIRSISGVDSNLTLGNLWHKLSPPYNSITLFWLSTLRGGFKDISVLLLCCYTRSGVCFASRKSTYGGTFCFLR